MLFSFFAIKKQPKSRQALHENIRAESLSLNCVQFFFSNLYIRPWLRRTSNLWKIQFLEDVVASQYIDYRYFYSYATTAPLIPSLPGYIITPQVKMTWNISLFIFYMICNVFRCDDFTVL